MQVNYILFFQRKTLRISKGFRFSREVTKERKEVHFNFFLNLKKSLRFLRKPLRSLREIFF